MSSYYIEYPKPPYDADEEYIPGTPVILRIAYKEGSDTTSNELRLIYDTPDHLGSGIDIPIGDYQYFRVFARADLNHFELEVSMYIIAR